MAPGEMTTAQLEADIVLSRGSIAKQRAMLARLAEEGHSENLETGKAVLQTMYGHLAAEVERLTGLAPI